MAESTLGRLAGTWEFEPFVQGGSAGTGRVTFEWIGGGEFLLGRSVAEWTDPGWVENAPKTIQTVIGFDDTTLEVIQLYADDRGVNRIYRGSLTDAPVVPGAGGPRLPPAVRRRVPRQRADDRRPMGILAGRNRLGARLPDHIPKERNDLMTTARMESATRSPIAQLATDHGRSNTMTLTEQITRTLVAPGATLSYDVRPAARRTPQPCSSSARRWPQPASSHWRATSPTAP